MFDCQCYERENTTRVHFSFHNVHFIMRTVYLKEILCVNMDHGSLQGSIDFKSIYLYIHKLNWNCGPNISTDFLVEICQGLVDTQISRQALFYCAPHTFYVISKRQMQYFQICFNDIFCFKLPGFEKEKTWQHSKTDDIENLFVAFV